MAFLPHYSRKLFFNCCSSTVVSILPPPLSPTPVHPPHLPPSILSYGRILINKCRRNNENRKPPLIKYHGNDCWRQKPLQNVKISREVYLYIVLEHFPTWYLFITKEFKLVSSQWINLVDITSTTWSKLVSPVTRHADIMHPNMICWGGDRIVSVVLLPKTHVLSLLMRIHHTTSNRRTFYKPTDKQSPHVKIMIMSRQRLKTCFRLG